MLEGAGVAAGLRDDEAASGDEEAEEEGDEVGRERVVDVAEEEADEGRDG